MDRLASRAVNDGPRYTSLRDYLRVLREQRLAIVLITIVAAGVALFVSLRQQPVYQAVSRIAFQDEAQQVGVLGGGSVSPNIPTGKTPQARAQTIDEPAVLKRAQKGLPKSVSPAELHGAISTSLNEDSFLVDVTGTWRNADFAARLSNDFARKAVRYTNGQARAEYRSSLNSVQKRLRGLGNDIVHQQERTALTGQITRLRFLAENAETAHIAEAAQAPSAPSSPQTKRNVVLGLALGLVLGILVAFLRDTLDRRLRGSREVREELDFPLLGHVRAQAMGRVLRADGSDNNLQPDIEACRIIRQNLEFASPAERPLRTIVVTSAVPAEGKSTVATALAFASASAGKRTLLVEADLRGPDLAERLGVRPTPGLTDYLVGRAEPEEILQMVAPAGVASNGNGGRRAPGPPDVTRAEPLVCITRGTRSPQPAELLGSERLARFLDQVAHAYDTVILDSSPLLPVADTLKLLPRTDAVVLCVRSGQTTRDQAHLARSALEYLPGERPVGIVVTGVRRSDERDHGQYSYGYAYTGGPEEHSAV
jgi:succinoglycan biosynthesis transport protein ExoP